MPMFLVILALIGVLVVWLMVSYNGLVKARMHTKETWSQIDVQLKRRNDLIPNLVETVKGYANYEEKTLEKITSLRSRVADADRKSTRLNSSHANISYAVFCLKKKKI